MEKVKLTIESYERFQYFYDKALNIELDQIKLNTIERVLNCKVEFGTGLNKFLEKQKEIKDGNN